jgi:hypothetical protein
LEADVHGKTAIPPPKKSGSLFSRFLFPCLTSLNGVKEICDCNFHDLRRTFATTTEHLDVGHYKLKRLMNHVSDRNDVTAGYTVLTAETLRSSAIKIQKKLLAP